MTTQWPTSPRQLVLDTIQFFRDHPDRWVRGTLATDNQGNSVPPWSPRAQCFCFVGKMESLCPSGSVGFDPTWNNHWLALYNPLSAMGPVPSVNDDPDYTLPEVLAIFEDRASSLPDTIEGATL